MNLQLDEIQGYFDGKYELNLTFDYFYLNIDGIEVHLNNVPLLKNKTNNRIFFPTIYKVYY